MSDNLVMGKISVKRRIYNVAGFMATSAIFISGVIIVWFNSSLDLGELIGVYNKVELTAITLMPYMISAVVAAITAIGIMNILPSARVAEPAEMILSRIKELAAGDLTSTVKIKGESQLKGIARELNLAVANINSDVTDLKIINRQQWGLLCEIRMWAENNDCETLLVYVREMERNWDKIADIEEKMMT